MNIRWIKDPPNGGAARKGCCFYAVLEGDNLAAPKTDKPATWCLATIEERYLSVNVPALREFHQGLFWTAIDRNLAKLDIDPASRKKIEQQISEKVPRPSVDWALWGVVCVPGYD